MQTVKCELGETHRVDENNYLADGVLVKIDLGDIIMADRERFLDMIAEDAGFPKLEDISYEVEGHEGNTLLIRVRGNVSAYLGKEAAKESDAE